MRVADDDHKKYSEWTQYLPRELQGQSQEFEKKEKKLFARVAGGCEHKQEPSGSRERDISPRGERLDRKWPGQEVHPLQRFFAYLAAEGRTWWKCHYYYARQ